MRKPENQVAAAVDALFRRLPSLVGFAVQQAHSSPDLVVTHVEADSWPALARELPGEIAGVLFDLIEEEPAARELLRGRTFARSFH
jgi:hypothetical protein